jgi:HEAT repeat protein
LANSLTEAPTSRLSKVDILDELINDLNSPDPTARRKAIWELGQRGHSLAVQPLVRLMVSADSKERSLILAALSEISARTLKPMNRALSLSLQDENPEVRKNAIRDLTRIYDLMGQAGQLLSHAASDEDPEVRQTAAWAMDQFNRLRLKATRSEVDTLPGRTSSTGESLPYDTEYQ